MLALGKSDLPAAGTSKSELLETGLPGCPYRFLESGELPFTDGNPAYGLQLHHPRFLEVVGALGSVRDENNVLQLAPAVTLVEQLRMPCKSNDLNYTLLTGMLNSARLSCFAHCYI